MPATLGQTVCNALIDTGATRSCLSEEYYLQLLLRGLKPIHRLLVQRVLGGNLQTTGSVKCDFKLGEKQFSFDFIVSKNLSRPCILGLDFLRKHRIGIGWSPNGKFQLDFHKQVLVGSIKVYMTGPSLQVRSHVNPPSWSLVILNAKAQIEKHMEGGL